MRGWEGERARGRVVKRSSQGASQAMKRAVFLFFFDLIVGSMPGDFSLRPCAQVPAGVYAHAIEAQIGKRGGLAID